MSPKTKEEVAVEVLRNKFEAAGPKDAKVNLMGRFGKKWKY